MYPLTLTPVRCSFDQLSSPKVLTIHQPLRPRVMKKTANGSKTREEITSGPIIILDFVFGDQKSGWQMLQMIKMKRSTASIPVIVCTAALDMVREQEGYLVSQGVHVVFKPFDIDHLLTNIKQLLNSHEQASSI